MATTTDSELDGIAGFVERHAGPKLRSIDRPTLAAYRARSDARLVVRRAGDRTVGVAALRCRPDLATGRRVAVVDALAVAPGSDDAALLAAIERSGAELGCGRIEGQVELDVGPGTTTLERFVRTGCAAAEEIVGLIDGLRDEPDVGIGADGAATKSADRAAETCALRHLGIVGVPICSEERGHVGGRPEPNGRWIAVDPIDGTRNFVRGLPPYAFAAALIDAGEPVAGVVVDLTSGRRWIGRRGDGATVDGRPCVARGGGPVAVPSLAPGAEIGQLPDGHSRVRMSGSTTVDLCRVADGSLGSFVDQRRQVVHVHDLAAPLVVLREAGVPVTTGAGLPPELPPDPTWTTTLLVGDAARSAVPS